MDLTVVGCSGSVPGPASPASCYLLQAPYQGRTFTLLLDLGPGAFGALYRYLPDPAQVDAIALTHLHPDHCLDVCAFYVGARYSPTAPWPHIPLYGPAGTAERLARAYDVPARSDQRPEPGPGIAGTFDHRTWLPEQQIGPFTVSAARVDHPVESYALRLTERSADGATLVYSGDTGPCPALTELARGADLLLVEAAFLDRPDLPPGVHLSGPEAARTGQDAGVGRVVLTHIPPWHDPAEVLAEAEPHFSGEVALAEPGARWTVAPPR